MTPPRLPYDVAEGRGGDVQGSCAAIDPESRAGQNFCGSDDRCRNHDETAWCADSSLSPCPLLRPTIGGDCKLAGNLFAQFGNAGASSQPAALAAGVHFGPSAICLGVPGGRFARRGVAAWRLSETCFASQCDDDGVLTVLVRDAAGDGFSEYPCPEGEMIALPVEDGFEEGVRASFWQQNGSQSRGVVQMPCGSRANATTKCPGTVVKCAVDSASAQQSAVAENCLQSRTAAVTAQHRGGFWLCDAGLCDVA